VKVSPGIQKRAFLAVLLMLTLGFAWLIYRSNSGNGRPAAGLATVPGMASDSVGRFFSGLVNRRPSGGRSDARLADMMELKGIILSRRRPVAMINTKAFEQGEIAPLQLARREYSIHCLDIGSDQVKVQADESETITLQLKGRL
jgi:hypothetical protein